MLWPMAPRVEIVPAEASDPLSAPRQVALRSLESIPRRRAVTLAVAAHSLQPGLAPCPWTIRGTLDAIDRLSMRVGAVVLLGNIAAAETVFERGALGHAAHELSITARPVGRRQMLRLAESRRPAQIPMAWIGTNLVSLVPLSHRETRRGWVGPCESALDQLAELMGYEAPTDPTLRIGGRLVSEVFASSTTLIDAHWWAAADEHGVLCSQTAAPEHVLGAAVGEPYGHAAVDGWLAGLLNLRTKLRHHGQSAGTGTPPDIISVGGKRRPWPAVKLDTGPRTPVVHKPSLTAGIASRAVQALWGVGNTSASAGRDGVNTRTRGKLAPPLRGRFVQHWDEFRSVQLDAESA